MSWQNLENENPELAETGRMRLNGRVAYLATVQSNGAPRVHPVTPIVGDGRLFVFMEPTSPKGKDLGRGSSYALHLCGATAVSSPTPPPPKSPSPPASLVYEAWWLLL